MRKTHPLHTRLRRQSPAAIRRCTGAALRDCETIREITEQADDGTRDSGDEETMGQVVLASSLLTFRLSAVTGFSLAASLVNDARRFAAVVSVHPLLNAALAFRTPLRISLSTSIPISAAYLRSRSASSRVSLKMGTPSNGPGTPCGVVSGTFGGGGADSSGRALCLSSVCDISDLLFLHSLPARIGDRLRQALILVKRLTFRAVGMIDAPYIRHKTPRFRLFAY